MAFVRNIIQTAVMCGIAGVLTKPTARAPSAAEALRMAAVMRHRGPDGYGYLIDDELALVHTRLSLVDLEGGAQPISNEAGTLWLIANGEIFDHVEHRATLEKCGHRFRTHTDIEVLLHAYEEWGSAAWSRLDGQFAAVIWDTRARQLLLVRDRFGILPLNYAVTADSVVFGSEAKAIFASERLTPRLDANALRHAFTCWAPLAPLTAFEQVEALPPGCQATVSVDLDVRIESWWRPDFAQCDRQPKDLQGAADELERRLDTSVRHRLAADVPVASYLSGGVDSALLTALAARHSPGLPTFGMVFADERYDESAAQLQASKALGTDHYQVDCSNEGIRRDLPEVVWHCEAPLMRSAPVPLFQLSRLVRQHGFKAVLTGEAADEMFGGYSIFLEDRVRRFWARQPESTIRPALLARVHDFVGDVKARSSAMWRAFYATDLEATEAVYYSHGPRWRNSSWATRLLREPLAPADVMTSIAPLLAARLPPEYRTWSPLARAQAVEVISFMQPYLLASQGDRVALANSVEARYPFLAPGVAEFGAGLRDNLKLRGLRTKVALRAVAQRYLPEQIWNRPKQPYRAPVDVELFTPGDDYVGELLDERRLDDNPLLRPRAAKTLLTKARRSGQLAERESMALCGLLTVQLLDEQFCRQFVARSRAAAAALVTPADIAIDLTSSQPCTCPPHRT